MKSRFFFILAASIAIQSLNKAQENSSEIGSIRGQVYDGTTKELLLGANVQIVGTNLGASTDLEGQFIIPRVPVGSYSLRVSLLGYRPYIRTDVVVAVSRPAEIMIPMVESLIAIEAVQVTATYFQKIPDTPLSTLTQTNEEIRRLPGGLEDVVRAISILPGVAQVQAGRNDLIVRGGAPSENLFVVENLEVPNINHFGTQGASGGPLSFVNLDFVQGTTFSTGGFGARYGDKLSSVLALELREGRKDAVGGKATISASQFGLNLEGPISQSGDNFIFSARRSYLDFIFKAAGFGFVPEYWDFLGKAHFNLSPRDQLSVFGILALDNVRLFNETADQRFSNSRILSNDQTQLVGAVSWRHIMSKSYLDVTLGLTSVDYAYIQNDSTLRPIFVSTSLERELSLRVDYLVHIADKTEFSVGLMGKQIQFDSKLKIPIQVSSFRDSLSIDAAFASRGFKGAAFVQLSQEIGPARITGGLRADYFDQITSSMVLAPRLSGTVALSPTFNLNASIGRYHQAPSYVWLTANSLNRELSYIAADQYIVGIDHAVRGDTKVSVEAYVKKYQNYPASLLRPYLVLSNTGAGFGGSEDGYASFGIDPLVSKGTGLAQGVELLVQKKLSEVPCYGTVSVSYTKSDFTALDNIARPSSFDQRWILNVGGGYVFNQRWEMSAKFRYASGRPYTPFGVNGYQDSREYNSGRVQANHSLDVRVDRRWSFESWSLVTYIDVQNVYNKKPVDIPRYNVRKGIVEQEAKLGILPSIGVSAEF